MSEQADLNNDPLAQKLGRLTPDSSTLDRDALLVRLGQASVRGGRFWPIAAGALAVSQAITLFLLLTPRPNVNPPSREIVAPDVRVVPDREPSSDTSPKDPALWSHWKATRSGNLEDLPAPQFSDDSSAPQKVLTAHSAAAFVEFE